MITRREFLKLTPAAMFMIPPNIALSLSIQDMIDAAPDYSTVIVPQGTYSISEPIRCRATVSLDLRSAVIQADCDAILCAPEAHIYGGRIFTHNTPLVFDGSKHFGMTFPTFIQGVQLLGNWENPTGTGILMNADEGFVSAVCLSHIGISYFAKGIHLRSTGAAWVNGNILTDSILTICHRAIVLEKADGNRFDVQIQPDANCERALYANLAYHNRADLMVWDWAVPPAVEFTENTAYNKLDTDLHTGQVLDRGWNNDKRMTVL